MLSVFVPLVFCEFTTKAPEVLLATEFTTPAKVRPPVAGVRLNVAPSARFCVPVVAKSPPRRTAVPFRLPPVLRFSVPVFIR